MKHLLTYLWWYVGVGAAGMLSGAIILMVTTIPLHKRPLYQGFFGAVFGVASVLGPLLGQ